MNSNHPVALTRQMLDNAASVPAILDLDPVRNNWVKTYTQVSGKPDGLQRFEAEKILFVQTIMANNQLSACNRFSIYSAFTELAISGLTLRDGISYILPYKGVAKFMPGWKGRLEQINEMPNVVFVHEPQIVYQHDEYEKELGMQPRITKHIPAPEGERGDMVEVYLVIEFTTGLKVYFMGKGEIEAIRDNYSQSWKQYLQKVNDGKWEEWMDKPMWLSSPAQAWKKTLVKRVYGALPKLPKHKWLDAQVLPSGLTDLADDPEEIIAQQQQQGAAVQNEQPFDSFVELTPDSSSSSNATTQAPPVVQQPPANQTPPPPAPPAAEPKKRRTSTTKKADDAADGAADAAPKYDKANDPYLKEYTTEQVNTIVSLVTTATDIKQLANLYYQNTELIESNPHLKQLFGDNKKRLYPDANSSGAPQQQAAPVVAPPAPQQQQDDETF